MLCQLLRNSQLTRKQLQRHGLKWWLLKEDIPLGSHWMTIRRYGSHATTVNGRRLLCAWTAYRTINGQRVSNNDTAMWRTPSSYHGYQRIYERTWCAFTILKQVVDKIRRRMMNGLDGIAEKAYIFDEWTFQPLVILEYSIEITQQHAWDPGWRCLWWQQLRTRWQSDTHGPSIFPHTYLICMSYSLVPSLLDKWLHWMSVGFTIISVWPFQLICARCGWSGWFLGWW